MGLSPQRHHTHRQPSSQKIAELLPWNWTEAHQKKTAVSSPDGKGANEVMAFVVHFAPRAQIDIQHFADYSEAVADSYIADSDVGIYDTRQNLSVENIKRKPIADASSDGELIWATGLGYRTVGRIANKTIPSCPQLNGCSVSEIVVRPHGKAH